MTDENQSYIWASSKIVICDVTELYLIFTNEIDIKNNEQLICFVFKLFFFIFLSSILYILQCVHKKAQSNNIFIHDKKIQSYHTLQSRQKREHVRIRYFFFFSTNSNGDWQINRQFGRHGEHKIKHVHTIQLTKPFSFFIFFSCTQHTCKTFTPSFILSISVSHHPYFLYP